MKIISPGLVQGCLELLELTSRNALRGTEIRSSFPVLSGIAIAAILETSQQLTWIRYDVNGRLVHSEAGTRILEIKGYEQRLRRAILDYVEVERPPWIQSALSGRSRVMSFAGSQVVQCMIEANVARGTEKSIVSFWDSIAAIARGQKNDKNLEIGREGERYSIEFEETRTGVRPKWIGIESNEDGYDLLSVVDQGDLRPLTIEVKSSTQGVEGSLFLTRNEWDRACQKQNHVFHLWALNPPDRTLAVVSMHDIRPHIPTDSGHGSWHLALVPFSVFDLQFSSGGQVNLE